jgi:hypothetical protein
MNKVLISYDIHSMKEKYGVTIPLMDFFKTKGWDITLLDNRAIDSTDDEYFLGFDCVCILYHNRGNPKFSKYINTGKDFYTYSPGYKTGYIKIEENSYTTRNLEPDFTSVCVLDDLVYNEKKKFKTTIKNVNTTINYNIFIGQPISEFRWMDISPLESIKRALDVLDSTGIPTIFAMQSSMFNEFKSKNSTLYRFLLSGSYKNIIFQSVKYPFDNLLTGAKMIITATSDIGFKGLLLDKPVVTVGKPWYRFGTYEIPKDITDEDMKRLFKSIDKPHENADKFLSDYFSNYMVTFDKIEQVLRI